jgi:hypothetical protein
MNRKTLIAGALFAGLVLVAVVVMRSPEKGSRTEESARPVAKVPAGGIDTLEVTKGGVTTVLKKDGTTYKVEKPVAYAADQDAAKQAFETIEKLEFDGIVSDQKAKHDEYEVGASSVRVVAKKADKALVDLRIGKVANNQTMVRVEGKDEVWQAVGSLKFEFDKDAAAWRDKSITTFTEADAERLEVVSKTGGKIVLTKPAAKDGGAAPEWTVHESTVKVEPYDKTVAPGIVSALYAWKANDFADDAKPADTGLDAPDTTVTVGLKGGKKATVLVGKKKGEEDYYVKTADSPTVFLVKKYNLERVNKRPVEFREKAMCNLNEGEITEVSVSRDKESYTLVKQPGKTGNDAWKLAKPAGVTLDPAKVTGIVGAFKDWKATSFAEDNSPKSTGLVKPTATIAAKAKGAGCVLKVGAELSDKQNSYVEKAGAPDVFTVPKWSLDRVLVKVDDLKKKS